MHLYIRNLIKPDLSLKTTWSFLSALNQIIANALSLFVTAAYIQHGDYNVIVIDWSKITFRPYVWASNHVKKVGHFVSTMINFLAKHGMDLSKTTMVGHSLGAHVVGIAARETEGNVNYVVGKFLTFSKHKSDRIFDREEANLTLLMSD